MPEPTIPNLWPETVKVDVQTPYTILRAQANHLSQVTRGILEGDVETEASKEKVQHRLVVIAPAYNRYRHTLLVATHHPDLPYPAEVRAEALKVCKTRSAEALLPDISGQYFDYPSATNDEQMLNLVGKALRSEPTLAVLLSLIAKSNESTSGGNVAQEPQATKDESAEELPHEDSTTT